MSTTLPDTMGDQLAAADAEVARISEAIVSGDETYTTVDLIAAEQTADRLRSALARQAQLDAERKARETEASRVRRIQELEVFVRERFGPREGDVVDRLTEAAAALVPFMEALYRYNADLAEVWSELTDLGDLGDLIHVRPNRAGQLHVTEPDVFLSELDVTGLVAEVAWRATRQVMETGLRDRRTDEAVAGFEKAAGVTSTPKAVDVIRDAYPGTEFGSEVTASDLLRAVAERAAS